MTKFSVGINFGASTRTPEEPQMATIKVKTVEGRIAFDAPRGGKKIPDDKFVAVRETAYIRRLIEKHGDLIEESPKRKGSNPTEKPAAKPLASAKPIPAN